MFADIGTEIPTYPIRHHDIQKNEIRWLLYDMEARLCKRLYTEHLIALPFQILFVKVQNFSIVFNDQYFWITAQNVHPQIVYHVFAQIGNMNSFRR